jgi:hypothetical protein
VADREGMGHAQRLREVASMLRGAKQALEADAAYDCDRAAEWVERHSRTASDVFAEREPLLDTRGVSVGYGQPLPPADADASGKDSDAI